LTLMLPVFRLSKPLPPHTNFLENIQLNVNNIEHLAICHQIVVPPLSVSLDQHECAADDTNRVPKTIDHRQRQQRTPGPMLFKGFASDL